jgi:hypothetical protein
MREHRMTVIATAIAAAAMLAGCESMGSRVDCANDQYYGMTSSEVFPQTPRLDCTFGRSVDMAVARQIADKDAAARNAARPTAGMDGVAAKEAIDRYQKSFRTPEPNTSAFTIGVTGSQAGGPGQ